MSGRNYSFSRPAFGGSVNSSTSPPAKFLAVCIATCALYGTRPALADKTEDDTKAKHLFEAGAISYEKTDYLKAITAFEMAAGLSPKPGFVFSLAQAHRRQFFLHPEGSELHLHSAIENFEKYLKAVPVGGRRGDAIDALSALRPYVLATRPVVAETKVEIKVTRVLITSATPNAWVSIDGAKPSEAPLLAETTPGKHLVVVTAKGYDEGRREVQAVDGTVVQTEIPLVERPAWLNTHAPTPGVTLWVDGHFVGETPLKVPVRLPHGRHLVAAARNGAPLWSREFDFIRDEATVVSPRFNTSTQRKISYWLLGASGVALGSSGVFASLTFWKDRQATNILDEKSAGNIDSGRIATYESARLARDNLRTTTIVTASTGLGLGLVGLLLFVFDHPTPAAFEGAASPLPSPTPPKPPRPGAMDMAITPILAPGLVGSSFRIAF